MKCNKRIFVKFNLVALFSTLLVVGCATPKQPGEIRPSEQKIAVYHHLPSQIAINKAEEIYNNGKTKQLNFYAPNHYAIAGNALAEAKALLAVKDSHDQITNKAAIADAILSNGNLIMQRVKNRLNTELALKNKLDSLNAEAFDFIEYSGLLKRLNEIIIEIENGNWISNEITREQLVVDMKALIRNTIHFNAMSGPKKVLELVKQLGGETKAAITYQQALDAFNNASEFIQLNPDNEQAINQVGKEALFAANHALHITKAVIAQSKKTDESPEQTVLDEEQRLLLLTQQITNADFRDRPLERQTILVAQLIKDKITELNNKDELILALRDTLIEVRDSSNRLSLVSATAESLQKEKKEWLAKKIAYEKDISKLENQLSAIESQLYDTQNTIVEITNETIDVTDLIEMKINEVNMLETKIDQTLLENKKNRQTIIALQAQIAKQKLEKEAQQNKIGKLEQQLVSANRNLDALKLTSSTNEIAINKKPIDLEENRAKITTEETLQALESAKELIELYRTSKTNQNKRSSLVVPVDYYKKDNFSSNALVHADN